MKWGKILGDAAKTALILGAVGALLALASPVIATVLSLPPLPPLMLSVPWNAAFFGAFGALNTILTPVIKNMLGDKGEDEAQKRVQVNVVVASPALGHGRGPMTVNHHHGDNNVLIDQDVNAVSVEPRVGTLALGGSQQSFAAVEEARRLESVLLGASQKVH